MRRGGGAAALIAAFLIVAGTVAWFFPPVSTDEVVATARSWEILKGRGSHYTLYNDVFHPSVYAWRDLSPDNVRVVHNLWLIPFLALGGRGHWAARCSSIVAGALALLFLWLFLRRRLTGLGAEGIALLAVHPLFWLAAVLVRPEMPLLAAVAGILWLIDALPSAWEKKSPLLGLLMGLSVGFHPNAAPLLAGVCVHWHLSEPAQRTVARWSAWAVGVAVAGLSLVAVVDLKSFAAGMRIFGDAFYRVPFVEDWRPWRWLGRPASFLFAGDSFYLREAHRGPWVGSLRVAWAIFFGAAILGVARAWRSSPTVRSLASAWAVWWVTAAALVSRREALYGALALPLLYPLVVLGMFTVQKKWRGAVIAGLATLQLAAGAGAVFSYRSHYLSEGEIQRAFRRLVPDEKAKILGPNRMWFLAPDRTRDLGALVFSRWFTGRSELWGECLASWRPEVVVLDPFVKKNLLGPGDSAESLARSVPARVTLRGLIDTGSGGDGLWEVLSLQWPSQGRNPS